MSHPIPNITKIIITNMLDAIFNNDIEIVKKLITEMPSLNNLIMKRPNHKPPCPPKMTFLMYACSDLSYPYQIIEKITIDKIKKRYEIIEFIIESGADMNKQNKYKETALFGACKTLSKSAYFDEKISEEFAKIIYLLLDKGADINIIGLRGSLLHYLFMVKINETVLDVAEILIKKGINVNVKIKTEIENSFSFDNYLDSFDFNRYMDETAIETLLRKNLFNWLKKNSDDQKKYNKICNLITLMFDFGLNIEKDKLCISLMKCNDDDIIYGEFYSKLFETIYEYDLKRELAEKDKEIVKLKKEIEELCYKPGNPGYLEAAEDFEALKEKKN